MPKFHDSEFDEATLLKLEIFNRYIHTIKTFSEEAVNEADKT